MKSRKRPNQTLPQVLNSFDQRLTLQLLAYVQRRRACEAVIQGLLQARLANLTSAPVGTTGPETLLTVPEAAKRLKLSRPRIYELVRQRKLPKFAGLGTQVRIPASALKDNIQATLKA